MARTWDEASTMALLEHRLQVVAPENIATLPISCAKERQANGEYLWTVDIHVHVPRVTEYEVAAAGPDLAAALRRAYIGLNNEANLRVQAAAANRQLGIDP